MTQEMPREIYALTDKDGDYMAFSEYDALATSYIRSDIADKLADALEKYIDGYGVTNTDKENARAALQAYREGV